IGVGVLRRALEVAIGGRIARPRFGGVLDDGRAIGGSGGAVAPPVVRQDRTLRRRIGLEADRAALRVALARAIVALAHQDPVHAVVAVPEVLQAGLTGSGRGVHSGGVVGKDLGAVAGPVVLIPDGVPQTV